MLYEVITNRAEHARRTRARDAGKAARLSRQCALGEPSEGGGLDLFRLQTPGVARFDRARRQQCRKSIEQGNVARAPSADDDPRGGGRVLENRSRCRSRRQFEQRGLHDLRRQSVV